jgi:hypothetical protein
MNTYGFSQQCHPLEPIKYLSKAANDNDLSQMRLLLRKPKFR